MPHRAFTDTLGRTWDVWAVFPTSTERRTATPSHSTPAVDRRLREESRVLLGKDWARGWLTFETDGEKRRLAPCPEDWATKTEAELEALCAEAVPVPPSRRLIE